MPAKQSDRSELTDLGERPRPAKLGARLSRVYDRFVDALAVLAGLQVIFMVGSVFVGVVMRYFVNQPIGWIIEINEYLVLIATFFTAPWVLKENAHVKLDLLFNALNVRHRLILRGTTSAFCTLICLFFTWYGTQLAVNQYKTGYFTATTLGLPKCWFTAVIPFGFALMAIGFARDSYMFWQRRSEAIKEIAAEEQKRADELY